MTGTQSRAARFDAKTFDADDWFSRWDMEAVPDLDDKVQECNFFFQSLAVETDRARFRWIFSAFLNAAYSFFETSALAVFFRIADADGEAVTDSEGLSLLGLHVEVWQNPKNPEYVKTGGRSDLTKKLYGIRKKSTHHHSLSIMEVGASLPEDFHLGSMRGEGVPVMPFCREVMELVRNVHDEMN